MASDRRQYPRLAVRLPVLVSLGITKVGLLFDLGEGGLSVHGLFPKSQAQFHFVSFGLPEGECFIEARAEITWTSDSKNRTGLRFVQVGDRSQRKLREWIGARSSAIATSVADLGTFVPQPAFTPFGSDAPNSLIPRENVPLLPQKLSRGSEPSKAGVTPDTTFSPHSKPRHRFTLFLVASLLCPPLVLLGYYLPSLVEKLKFNKIKVWSRTTQLSSERAMPPVDLSPARGPNLPSRLPVDQPGFVLQVGAMKNEEHADALAATFNRRNFPAFVFRRNNDSFYRVVVGPYNDLDSSNKVKDELEKQNFNAILRRWSPE